MYNHVKIVLACFVLLSEIGMFCLSLFTAFSVENIKVQVVSNYEKSNSVLEAMDLMETNPASIRRTEFFDTIEKGYRGNAKDVVRLKKLLAENNFTEARLLVHSMYVFESYAEKSEQKFLRVCIHCCCLSDYIQPPLCCYYQ